MLNRMLAKLPLALALALALASLGCNEEKKTDSIAVVDAEAVFQKSKLAAAGMQHIDSLNSDMQKRLGEMQKELQADPDNHQLEQKLQSELFGMQTNMDAAQRAVAERINHLFDAAVEEYRKAQGLEVVLPKQLVMAAREDGDITEKVVEIMDKNTVDFSDIKLGKPEETAGQGSAQSPAQTSGQAAGQVSGQVSDQTPEQTTGQATEQATEQATDQGATEQAPTTPDSAAPDAGGPGENGASGQDAAPADKDAETSADQPAAQPEGQTPAAEAPAQS